MGNQEQGNGSIAVLAGAPLSSPFDRYDAGDVRFLVEHYPLAWVMADGGAEASLLPLIGVFDARDNLVELIGHFARSNPLHAALSRDSAATILFAGPQSYISPTHAERRDWAPTWNFAGLHIRADVSVEPDFTAEAVDRLVAWSERNFAKPWCATELRERYAGMMTRIIGFRARVTGARARFKMGQDETDQTLSAILSNIDDMDLGAWMRRFNRDRMSGLE